MTSNAPPTRDGFSIAIVCALNTEHNAAALIFDEFWDENGDLYGKAGGDLNHYTTGRISQHNVVLALLPQMGKVNAASAAASMRSSFRALRLVLLVGICGGIPKSKYGDVLLGDVVVSASLFQYDFGRRYPHKFERKDTTGDNLGRPNKEIRVLLAYLGTDLGMDRLESRTISCLDQLQAKAASKRRVVKDKYTYPGTSKDLLFDRNYRHKHQTCVVCICRDCKHDTDAICEDAVKSSCIEVGCDLRHLVERGFRLDEKRRLEKEDSLEAQQPAIHIGPIASGDAVIKSAAHRDQIAKEGGVIGIEMEGAGLWDEVPIIVIKGVCDYADSHKHKGWQNFAAATAASVAKAVLEQYTQVDNTENMQPKSALNSPKSSATAEYSAPPGVSGPIFNGNLRAHTLIAGSTMEGGTYNFS